MGRFIEKYLNGRLCVLIIALFSFPSIGFAGTYWVSPGGTSLWANCSGTIPLNDTLACSLSTANGNASAGDTVYLRGGTYTISGNYVAGIEPTKSGTNSNNRITYVTAPNETPILVKGTGTDIRGLMFEGKSYIKIEGIIFKNFFRWGMIFASAHHNEIVNCTFMGDTGEEGGIGLIIQEGCSGGSSYLCPSTHNWIHNNTFSKIHTFPAGQTCIEGADVVRIGYPGGTGNSAAGNDNNTVENNYIEYGGHALLDNYGMYTVFRNNILHNEPWIIDYSKGTCSSGLYPNYMSGYTQYNGKYGHRGFQLSEDFGRVATYVLVEGNRVGYASTNPGNAGATNFELAAPKNIVRYNSFYGGMQGGLNFKYRTNGNVGQGGMGCTDNRVYNNTIYHNGYGYSWITYAPSVDGRYGLNIFSQTSLNVVKNNIVYGNGQIDIYDPGSGVAVVVNNWVTSNGDPMFVNPDLTNPSSSTLPDLRIQSSSPVIDRGTYLTQATNTGANSTSLTVSDALYFQDGSWGSDLARGVTFFADWIAIGKVTNVVQISGINYSTNTITLASPMTWSNGASIWLYKKSDGSRVLTGFAPDMGAYEFGDGVYPPQNLRKQ